MGRYRTSRRLAAVLCVMACFVAVGSSQIRRGGGAGGWVLLGTSHVDGNSDHDKIQCHGKDTYRALKLRVAGSTIQFDRLKVVYGNHQERTLPFRFRIAAGGTRTADLPGDERDIAYVEMWYEKASWSTKPEVQLFGMR